MILAFSPKNGSGHWPMKAEFPDDLERSLNASKLALAA